MAALHDALEKLRYMPFDEPALARALPLVLDVVEHAAKINLNCHTQQRKRAAGQPAGLRCRRCARCVLNYAIGRLLAEVLRGDSNEAPLVTPVLTVPPGGIQVGDVIRYSGGKWYINGVEQEASAMLKNGATPEQAHEWDEDHDREGVAGNVIEQDIEDALIADHERRHRG